MVRVTVPPVTHCVKRSKAFMGTLTHQLAMLGVNACKAKGWGGDTQRQQSWSGRGGCGCHRWCDAVAERGATASSQAALESHQHTANSCVQAGAPEVPAGRAAMGPAERQEDGPAPVLPHGHCRGQGWGRQA